ncbi:MAG TPA: hypothetical protein VKB86_06995, partial [Pyrinomonadaceae bacterium]|nr:hypothetical protein [Pyrinomonadaceae bacterium]
MAIGSIISSALGKMVRGWIEKALQQGGSVALKKFLNREPVQKAIRATANAFPFIPTVKESLERWIKSEEFEKLLAEINAGHIKTPVSALVESFIIEGGFFHGIDDPTDDAVRVLDAFHKNLVVELLKSPSGPVIDFRRAEER